MALARNDLRALAQAKVDDAALLYLNRRYSNSYYLFGYGAELALKARIARVFLAEAIPDKGFVNSVFTHDLAKLVSLSGLAVELEEKQRASPEFAANWATTVNWSEESRYTVIDEFSARAMHDAMVGEDHGVFEWLRNHW